MAITKVFRSGNSQAVRIPRDLQFETDQVEILRRGDEIILRKPRGNMAELFDVLTAFTPDFFEQGRDQGLPQKRRGL